MTFAVKGCIISLEEPTANLLRAWDAQRTIFWPRVTVRVCRVMKPICRLPIVRSLSMNCPWSNREPHGTLRRQSIGWSHIRIVTTGAGKVIT